ncbi:RKI1 [Candida jiufengensis]|uniref:RKI1 n=1 Tax=Candida jiufengensis TaxID=497108 RepID=UPI002224DC0E|nr:RKI1 [Candida jiufengensis]KAI5953184.1 RKI1 [Candida jiufengensis]
MSKIESAKKLAAYKAVDENLPPNAKIIGIGSGSTVVYVAERIGQLENKDQFICISTGFQSKQLIIDNGLTLGHIDQHPNLDIAFDGADEVDSNLNLIKGGGACLFQEKLVASAAKKLIIVADYRKQSKFLGENWSQGIPIEVVPIAFTIVIEALKKLGAKRVDLRQGGKAKAGPVISDNNNFILDADFGEIKNPEELHLQIKNLVGVVETGLFTNITEKVYFGEDNGDISIWGGKAKIETVIEESN